MNYLDKYKDYVHGVMSEQSKDVNKLNESLLTLNQNINSAALVTAAFGLAGECGEVIDIIKKITLQGKPFTPELKKQLVSEAGDVFWYLAALAVALDVTMEDMIDTNITKLKARFPDGFSVERSENRKKTDI